MDNQATPLTEEELTFRKRVPGIVDKCLEKIASRKLVVWTTATVLASFAHIRPEDWVTISLVYIGSQGAIDLAVAWKRAGK
jgi:hypothetical protein